MVSYRLKSIGQAPIDGFWDVAWSCSRRADAMMAIQFARQSSTSPAHLPDPLRCVIGGPVWRVYQSIYTGTDSGLSNTSDGPVAGHQRHAGSLRATTGHCRRNAPPDHL